MPLIIDHVLEVGACISPRISVCLACSITVWKGTRICSPAITPAGIQGCVTQWLKPHARKLSRMFSLLFLMASSSLKEKEEAASYQKGLRGVLEGKGKWRREQGRRQELENGVWIGAEEDSTPELQTRLGTPELLQTPVLCTWLMGSDTSPLMPDPYRAILLLSVTFNSLRRQYHQLQVWILPTPKEGVNSLPLTELLHLVLHVFASV